jgi:glycerophosphoryl diester phosphodiesterase
MTVTITMSENPVHHLELATVCQEAREKFAQLDSEGFKHIIEKLDYLIVSFNADKNPVGLYEVGEEALEALKQYKEKNTRKVAQKLLDSLDKALKAR